MSGTVPRRDGSGVGAIYTDKRPRRRAWWRPLAVLVLFWACVFAGGGYIGWKMFMAAPPTQAELWRVNRIPSVTIRDMNDEIISVRGAFYGDVIPLEKMPEHVINAFLATEDRRFYKHGGLDTRGLVRATLLNLAAGRFVQGGSTITQQLAKNLFLSSERTVLRKLEEVAMALWLERYLSKEEILTLYLNRIYLGAGTYGVDAAARRYFGKPATRLSLAEAVMLAGLPKAPSRYSPTVDLDAAKERASLVLDNMLKAGHITEGELILAQEEKVEPIEPPDREGLQYFADYVIAEARRRTGGTDTDIVIYTTIDPDMQIKAEQAVAEAMERDAMPYNADQAALVALATTGEMRAMVGGRSYVDSQFNRAVQAARQPGSAFKPVLYLAALEAGLKPGTVLRDEPIKIDKWRPRNYDGRYRGKVTLRQALTKSINSVAVRVSERIGRENVIGMARRLGISSSMDPHPSIALGTYETSVLELAGAYATIANGGMSAPVHALRRVESVTGDVLYTYEKPEPKRLYQKRHAVAMTNMLHHVLLQGTGKAAGLGRRPAAGKTGTTQDSRDAWFMGYTSQYVAGVWVGNDDNRPMRRVAGGGLPAIIWRDFMASAHEKLEVAELEGAYAVEDNPKAEEYRRFLRKLSRRLSSISAVDEARVR
ncbi:MAG: transglycosylase domain-containing protein [Alphaproteobacteria bacterium]